MSDRNPCHGQAKDRLGRPMPCTSVAEWDGPAGGLCSRCYLAEVRECEKALDPVTGVVHRGGNNDGGA